MYDIEKEREIVLDIVLILVKDRKLKTFSKFSGINYRTLLEIRYNKCKPKYETIERIKANYAKFQEGC